MTRILGIDPGSVKTGVGIIDASAQTLVHVHHVTLKVGKGDFSDRLRQIFEQLTDLIHVYQPDEVAIEDVFVAHNAQSALKLGQARGAAICAAVAMHKPVSDYAPRAVKQAIVGQGSADKTQMQHMVRVLMGLAENPPEDAADALGVAICHAHHRQTRIRLERHR